ncbi:MAG: hypothetical protein IT449_15505 [Phycisphaerales bacterium]|nr:hypothetical protein [Phycisphaerales bacterium]
MTQETPPPVLQALVLADHIYTDTTGKKVICGTFSQIWSLQFPNAFSRTTWAYIVLADVMQPTQIQLRFVYLNDNRILMQSRPVTVKSVDPLTPLEVSMEVPNLPLPAEGAYSLECWTNGTMIGSLRLKVSKREEQASRENQNE